MGYIFEEACGTTGTAGLAIALISLPAPRRNEASGTPPQECSDSKENRRTLEHESQQKRPVSRT